MSLEEIDDERLELIHELHARIRELEAALAIMTKDRDSLLESVRRTTIAEVADQIQAQRTQAETKGE